MTTVLVAVIGPLPQCLRRYTYLLIVLDIDSGWLSAYPMANNSVPYLSEIFVTGFCGSNPIPSNILFYEADEARTHLFVHGLQHYFGQDWLGSIHANPEQSPSNTHNHYFQIFYKLAHEVVKYNPQNWEAVWPKITYHYNTQEITSRPHAPVEYHRQQVPPKMIDPPIEIVHFSILVHEALIALRGFSSFQEAALLFGSEKLQIIESDLENNYYSHHRY